MVEIRIKSFDLEIAGVLWRILLLKIANPSAWRFIALKIKHPTFRTMYEDDIILLLTTNKSAILHVFISDDLDYQAFLSRLQLQLSQLVSHSLPPTTAIYSLPDSRINWMLFSNGTLPTHHTVLEERESTTFYVG